MLRTLTLAATLLIGLPLAVPTQAATLEEDNLLLLDFVLDRQLLASSVTGYTIGDTAVVSLAEAAAALEFPIIVDPVAGTASGSFIRPERTFSLNMAGSYVEIEGRRVPFTSDEVLVHQGAIFVSVATFSRWFPVELRFQPATLSIEVSPRVPLPVQERQARRSSAQQITGLGPATLPRIDSPYKLLGPFAADVNLGYSINRPVEGGKAITGFNYATLLSGDLAYMDSHFYLGGNYDEPLTQARMNLTRDNLGLPLGLRYIEIGDIVPAIVSGAIYSDVERGFLIQGGGSATGRDDLLDSEIINLSGDALEGWDVELFQNGMRIGYQTIDSSGRYNFTNIEPLAGENTFELVFYGPAGERRTETVTRYSGLEPDQPGSVRYQFSASQKGEQIYEGGIVSDLNVSDRGSTRLAGSLGIRILPNLSLSGSWNSLTENGELLNYYGLNATSAWRNITFNAGAIFDPVNGTRWNGSLQLPAHANLWGFDTRFSHTQYTQSIPTSQGNSLEVSSRTGLTLSGPIGPVGTQFSLFHNREKDRTSDSASAGFTVQQNKINYGSTLNYYRFGSTPDGNHEPDQFNGRVFFSTQSYPLAIRGGLDFTLRPDTTADEYFIDSNLTVARDMSMNFALTYDPLRDITRYTSGLNWTLPQVILSPRINYDSDGQYSGFIYAALSLAPRPDRSGVLVSGRSLATSGTVAGRAFIDNDNSGGFSAGDEPLSDVTIRAPQAYRTAKTDENGVAYLTDLSPGRATDIVLDPKTLPSSQMLSTHAGNSVHPRPTVATTIDFPVIPTGEIDGHVYVQQLGKRVPLAGVMVELRDTAGNVVAFKISAYDGFFVFPDTPYGTYTLNLAGEQRKRATQPKVLLSRDQNLYSNIDILVTPSEAKPPEPTIAPNSATPALPTTPVAPAPAGAAPAASAQPAAAAKPAPAPAPAPTTVKPAPAAVTPTTSPLANGRLVQLGAFAKLESAQLHRQKLLALDLLKPEQIEIVPVDLGARGIFHRVVAKPVGTSADALCASLKTRGAECFVVKP